MKKMYVEPRMVVEDFTVSEMVAAKCQFDIHNMFSQQLSWNTPACAKAQQQALDNGTYDIYALVSTAYENGIDLDNADKDGNAYLNDGTTNGDGYCFTPSYQNVSDSNICEKDASNMTFLGYDHSGYNTPIPACSADAGSNPLQNS